MKRERIWDGFINDVCDYCNKKRPVKLEIETRKYACSPCHYGTTDSLDDVEGGEYARA